jgi:hypothetical protein
MTAPSLVTGLNANDRHASSISADAAGGGQQAKVTKLSLLRRRFVSGSVSSSLAGVATVSSANNDGTAPASALNGDGEQGR